MWFVFALISTLGWGFADLFYKKSSNDDKYSYLKTTIWVGLVMGVCAICLLPLSETKFSLTSLVSNAVKYSPASFSYIISMTIGYAGLKYLELSIISPVQNASGGLSMVVMLLFFVFTGRVSSIKDEFSFLDLLGTVIIVLSVIALAIVEKKINSADSENIQTDKKYKIGAVALIFPLLYCVFDTIGTAADGIILDEKTGLGLGEIDVIILYGLTFFLCSIICWIYLLIKTKKPYNPFALHEIKTKCIASLFEEFGQIFYVYAMAKNPVLAAPMIASYCIVSVILSRIFLKEKLIKRQYVCVFSVIIGILLLGISEGISS